MLAVISGDVPCMVDADGVHDVFLPVGVLPYALIKPPDGRPSVQHGIHLLHLEVTVRSSLVQAVYLPLVFAVRRDRHIIKRREPSLPDEVRYAVHRDERVEQVGKSFSV